MYEPIDPLDPPDLAFIMADHRRLPGDECSGDNYHCGHMWPCLTYRLAELTQKQAAALADARREGAVDALRAAAREWRRLIQAGEEKGVSPARFMDGRADDLSVTSQ